MSTLSRIVQQTTLSDEQKPAILASGDVAVTAGAGTGKTRTLVARYLSLLDGGLSPRQVAAITFTKKAAREMRNRVRDEVRRYLARTDLEDPVRSRWQDTYNDLDAARIGTIHSLCGEILRHHPAEAGLDPRFEMLDEGQMALLQARAVDEALAWAADQAEAARLFALWGERELRGIVSRMMAQRLDADEALDALPKDRQALRERWEAQIIASREQARAALLADPAFLRLDRGPPRGHSARERRPAGAPAAAGADGVGPEQHAFDRGAVRARRDRPAGREAPRRGRAARRSCKRSRTRCARCATCGARPASG